MKKLDLKTKYKHLYKASASRVDLLTVPKLNFLMIDGTGDPNGSATFENAIQSLYSVSYTLKFTIKKEQEIDYRVMPLEGLWWMENQPFDMNKKDKWKWTLMIMQPDIVTNSLVKKAIKRVNEKKGLDSISLLRFENFNEGLAVQTLHIGPYSEETPTIQMLDMYADEHGCQFAGKHHEIYLSDPRRVSPEKYKTILRHPVHK